MSPTPHNSVEVFYSYAHEDEALRDELKKHLANLKRQGVITDWYDRDISAGAEWNEDIARHLESARVVLLLISPDFMNSDYINDVEVKRAMERHESGRVIPVILRPVDWEGALFSKLQALPTDAKAVTLWNNQDEAFLTVAKAIRVALQELDGQSGSHVMRPNIPRPPTVGFVARRDKDGRDIIERLQEELAPSQNQLVVLSGGGGVGKTTLAEEAMRVLNAVFNQRVVLTSALGRDDYSLSTLLDDIVTQLGHPELRAVPPDKKEAQVQVLVASASTLIILDNLETIKGDESGRCFDFLNKRVSCPALITGREWIDGAHNIKISAMEPDEASEFLNRLIQQARDSSVFGQVNRGRIMTASERTPAVMEWIVGQIDLAMDPDTVLDELAHGGGDAAQQVFDRSFWLPQMGDDGRATLLALSLFAPDASRSGLIKVSGFGNNVKRLDEAVKRLARLHLLKPAGPRLIVAGLTRELAQARLSRDARADDFRKQFIAYFVSYAKTHAQSTGEDYDALETEKDNLLNAMDMAFEMKDWDGVTELAYLIARPVGGILGVRGYWDEALKRNEQAFKAAHATSIEINVGNFAHNQAVIHQNRGQLDKARRLYQQSLEISQKLGDQSGIAGTLHNLAALAQAHGELDEARRLYQQSLGIEQKLGHQSGIAGTLHNLAALAQAEGELDEARRLYQQTMEISQKLGNQSGIASTLHNLAALAQAQGELDEARRLYQQSLEIEQKLGNQSGIASTLNNLAALAQAQGESDEARRLYWKSLGINQRLGNQSGIAGTVYQLGTLAENTGDKREAARLFREALEIFEKLGSPDAEIARRSLARVEGISS
jgi:tetratricopeptide (TPR) repeat protein